MKVSRKYSRIGAEIRCSKHYLKMLAGMIYSGYDVYDQITYQATAVKNKGTGVVKFVAIPQVLPTETNTKFCELRFRYRYSWWSIELKFESDEAREAHEIALIMERHKSDEESPDPSSEDPESVGQEDFQL